MDTYWCPQPAFPTLSPLLNIFRPCNSDSILLFSLVLETHQSVQTHKAMSTSAKPCGIHGYPVKYFIPCGLQPACTDRHDEWGGKRPEAQSGDWYQGRYMRKWCKALKTCSPEDLAVNGRDELNSWYFHHWKGAKYLMLLYNFCCPGLYLK